MEADFASIDARDSVFAWAGKLEPDTADRPIRVLLKPSVCEHNREKAGPTPRFAITDDRGEQTLKKLKLKKLKQGIRHLSEHHRPPHYS